ATVATGYKGSFSGEVEGGEDVHVREVEGGLVRLREV
ncbi:MAG: hypothetical protein RLZZ05_354, partial [Bacteroidota bacterium]